MESLGKVWADGFQTCSEALWIFCHRLQRIWTCLPWTAETEAVAVSSVAVVQGYLPMQVTLTFIVGAGRWEPQLFNRLWIADWGLHISVIEIAFGGSGRMGSLGSGRWENFWEMEWVLGEVREVPRVRRGKRVVVSWDMCEDREKARMGQWLCQGRALSGMESWPKVVSMTSESAGGAGVSLFLPLASHVPPPTPPGPSKLQGTRALRSQSTLLRDPHTNALQSCTEQFSSSGGNSKKCENFRQVLTTVFH